MKSDNMAAANVRINPIGVALLGAATLLLSFYVFGIPSVFKSEQKINMKELLSVSIEVARRGGDRVKTIRDQDNMHEAVKGETKEGAKEKYTDGDLESHRAMVHGLQKAYPNLKIISEEHESKPFDMSKIEDPNKALDEVEKIESSQSIPMSDITVWVDPLDATQEYTENLREFVTTMVCVAVRGRPTIGVIHHAFSGKTVWGYAGYGHSANLKEGMPAHKETDPYRIIVSRSHAGDVEKVAKEAFGEKTKIIPAGGAGYKTVQVIDGEADAYVHVTRIKKWDICAGNAILLATKGQMTTLEGRLVDYSDGNPINDLGLVASINDHKMYLDMLKGEAEALRKKNAETPH